MNETTKENEFECSVCQKRFTVPQEALAKYPNWTPRYCRDHSPTKNSQSSESKNSRSTTPRGAKRSSGGSAKGSSAELNLTLAEVLERFEGGPQDGLFTDGSARPNPGPGGWGVVHVENGNVVDQKHGSEGHTTNNRMELVALREALKSVGSESSLTIYTDSELSLNILTKWASGWEKAGWKRKSGPIKNLDLVQEVYGLFKDRPHMKIEWIKAHNGWRWNEYADSLATAWDREEL